MIKALLGAVALSASVGTALGEAKVVSGEALRQVISGRTIVLSSAVGGIPITYRADGTLAGKVNTFQAMAGAGPKQDSGRWWIVASQVCQKWNAWLDGRQYCYEMRVAGNIVHWRRNDGRAGTAKIANP